MTKATRAERIDLAQKAMDAAQRPDGTTDVKRAVSLYKEMLKLFQSMKWYTVRGLKWPRWFTCSQCPYESKNPADFTTVDNRYVCYRCYYG